MHIAGKRLASAGLFAVIALSGFPGTAYSQFLKLPDGYANAYASVTPGLSTDSYPEQCGRGMFAANQFAASVFHTCRFLGFLGAPAPYDVGNFLTSSAASFERGGALRARASLTGIVSPHVRVSNDALAVFSDAMTVTGPFVPASVVFMLAIDGVYANSYGTPGNPVNGGRVDMVGWVVNPDGTIAFGRNLTGAGLIPTGDGSTNTMRVVMPWHDYAFGNTIAYQLGVAAFARAMNNTDSPINVSIGADYSNTAQIQSFALFDAAGNDITAVSNVTFASRAVTTTPEPGTLTLLATGLVGLLSLARKRRLAA
jgi:hypothetical protein